MCAPVKEIEKRLKRIIKIMDELLVIIIMNNTSIVVVIVIKIMDELLVSEDIIIS